MAKKYKTQITIRFREADPARIMYFAHLVSLAHDVFENFITEAGYKWKDWFQQKDYLIPIRHVEADYKAPFYPGETYDVEASVESFGQTSFKMKYIFTKNNQVHGMVKMVHAILDGKNHQKTEIPDQIRKRLSPYLEKSKNEGVS